MEQKEDGIWKGSLMKEGRMAKAGFFPADHVVLINNSGKTFSPPGMFKSYKCCQMIPNPIIGYVKTISSLFCHYLTAYPDRYPKIGKAKENKASV